MYNAIPLHRDTGEDHVGDGKGLYFDKSGVTGIPAFRANVKSHTLNDWRYKESPTYWSAASGG